MEEHKRNLGRIILPRAGLMKGNRPSEFIESIANVTIKRQPSG